MTEIDARPRIRVQRTASKDEIVLIRTMINHPMESGNRIGPDGERVPRHIINRFVCSFNNELVLDMEIGPSISANPFFEFEARVPETGTFNFFWYDDSGMIFQDSATIEVI